MNIVKENKKRKIGAKDLVQSALLIALVYISTAFINIRLPIIASGGLVHLGTVMLIVSAIVFGKNKGAIAGAVGMAIFDLASMWTVWAPFTFVIRGIMGYIIGVIAYSKDKEGNSILFNTIGVVIASIWMIAGYYITEVILYGNWAAPLSSIPGNLTQITVGLLLGLPIAKVLKKYSKYL